MCLSGETKPVATELWAMGMGATPVDLKGPGTTPQPSKGTLMGSVPAAAAEGRWRNGGGEGDCRMCVNRGL